VKSATLGISDFILKNEVVVYPNPAIETIQIISKNTILSNIVITDILGKPLYRISDVNKDSLSIDISSFSKGAYFVIINEKTTKKLIKN
jgi:hypothetical protein